MFENTIPAKHKNIHYDSALYIIYNNSSSMKNSQELCLLEEHMPQIPKCADTTFTILHIPN
jgi:hypothetical protein